MVEIKDGSQIAREALERLGPARSIDNPQVILEVAALLKADAKSPSSMFRRVGEVNGNQVEVVTAERTKFRIAVARILEGDPP